MRLDVGPVAPASAAAWLAWADDVRGGLRHDPAEGSSYLPMLFGAGGYLDQWKRPDHWAGGAFRWQADVDPDELEYLVHGFLRLDAQLSIDRVDGAQPPVPCEGREFYLVLVRDLLHALEMEGRGRAAFVDQLRCCWPSAAEAN